MVPAYTFDFTPPATERYTLNERSLTAAFQATVSRRTPAKPVTSVGTPGILGTLGIADTVSDAAASPQTLDATTL